MLPGESITEIEVPVEETAPEGDGFDGDNESETAESFVSESETAESAPADPFAEFGGADSVRQAHQLRQALQTQDGVMRLFFEAGRSMGLGLNEMQQLFGQAQQPAAAAPSAPQWEDDDVLTYGQVKQLLQEQVLQPWQQSEAERAEAVARQTVTSVQKELGIEDQDTWAAVLQLGDRYLGDDLSPDNVAKAIRQGHDDFVKLVKGNAQKYVQRKAEVKKSVPKAPAGGSTPTSAPEAEPKTVEEAIKRARARLLGD